MPKQALACRYAGFDWAQPNGNVCGPPFPSPLMGRVGSKMDIVIALRSSGLPASGVALCDLSVSK